MDLLVSLLALGLSTLEELRWSSVREQPAEQACGLAVATSLLELYCGRSAGRASRALLAPRAAEPPEAGDPAPQLPGRFLLPSLAELGEALEAEGVRTAAFLMDREELEECLRAGYAPLVAHYARPRPHFSLVLGAGEGYVVTADPARGVEALSEAAFRERWSGAVLLVDRAALSPEGRGLCAAAIGGALARVRLLEAGAATRAAIRATATARLGGTTR